MSEPSVQATDVSAEIPAETVLDPASFTTAAGVPVEFPEERSGGGVFVGLGSGVAAEYPQGRGGPLALDQVYADLRDSWIGGAPARESAPKAWLPVLGDEPDEAERRLAALAGQAFGVGLRPVAPPGIQARSLLPSLVKPPIPDAIRPLFATAWRQESGNPRLLDLVDARGFTAHPLDWFPAASADVPDAYAPWQDWLAGVPEPAVRSDVGLDDDTWPYYAPGQRRVLLKAMRQTDPDAARELIAAHAAAEPADARAKLVGVLATNLSPADTDYLRTLVEDRSGRVREVANLLLGRLGLAFPIAGLDELGGFVDVTLKGLISKRVVVTPVPLKTTAQKIRRAELFARFSLAQLAGQLRLTRDDLIEAWALGADAGADELFASMVAASAAEAQVAALAGRLVTRGADALPALLPLLDRAPRETKQAALRVMLDALDHTPLLRLEPDLATPDVVATRRVRDVLDSFAGSPRSLFPLAFVATPAAAQAVLDHLLQAGARRADPLLASLRLNVQLAEYRPLEP